MIIALDIETIGNKDMIPRLPEPKIDSRLKDPVKIEAKKIEARQHQIDKMALDPLTARVVTVAAVGLMGSTPGGEQEHVQVIQEISDAAERDLLQSVFRMLGKDAMRLITWNGIAFDLPMIYKRAMLLGVDPGNFGAPPLSAWTKRYKTDAHYDLMQIWGNWRDFVKLDAVAGIVLGNNKEELDVTQIADLLLTEEGKEKVASYCLKDTRLTWKLWERFNGTLFV